MPLHINLPYHTTPTRAQRSSCHPTLRLLRLAWQPFLHQTRLHHQRPPLVSPTPEAVHRYRPLPAISPQPPTWRSHSSPLRQHRLGRHHAPGSMEVQRHVPLPPCPGPRPLRQPGPEDARPWQIHLCPQRLHEASGHAPPTRDSCGLCRSPQSP